MPVTILQLLIDTHNSGFLASSLGASPFWLHLIHFCRVSMYPLGQVGIVGQRRDQGIRILPSLSFLDAKLYGWGMPRDTQWGSFPGAVLVPSFTRRASTLSLDKWDLPVSKLLSLTSNSPFCSPVCNVGAGSLQTPFPMAVGFLLVSTIRGWWS